MLVAESLLANCLSSLRRTQNADGGWGYLPAKKSWLEPTVYAALALHGDPAADRAWTLVESWQSEDGSFRPAADVSVSSWGTSLALTLAAARGRLGSFRRSVDWLLGVSGVESRWRNRMAARMGWLNAERDLTLKGWPWSPNTSSWVEPTAHALIALKKAEPAFPGPEIRERIRLGQAQLLDVRCSDAGWNYGSRAALRVDLPSYPETTGLALLGLQGQPGLQKSLDLALRLVRESNSAMARAWLTLALRLHGAPVPALPPPPASPDLQILALEALAAPEGNFELLKTAAEARVAA